MLVFCATGCAAAGKRAAWFLPDRAVDAADMVGASVGVGLLLGADVHVTRWMSLNLEYDTGYDIASFPERNYNAHAYYVSGAAIGPFQGYDIVLHGVGTNWGRNTDGSTRYFFRKRGMFSLDDEIVREGFVDPWGIGLGLNVQGIGVHLLEVHPVECADFALGLLSLGFVDISKDDYALRD